MLRSENAYWAAAAILSTRRDPLSRKASLLLHFILEKYHNNEQHLHTDMLRLISMKYKEHFPKILNKATSQLKLVYGLELKVDNPNTQSYVFVSKLPIPPREDPNSKKELPKTGLVLALLGVIFMNGNHATEEQVWEFLNVLGVHPGRRHLIFGDPCKFITKDLVEQRYLECHQVPYSNPPTYEFLWGPRAYSETTKMKVLEIIAKIKDTLPGSFPDLYEEALCDKANRAGRRAEALGYSLAKTRILS
ncbi:melanoma-associated antigen B4-like [Nannospalax galili]|uniref:melanoma-associated antigen B4-like n=1 Tax=Nannospalax galili TaxID=1026970 RepID=UPI0004ED2DBD|nr:melanoma-associated antigen B4-like [Nannospalax galili]